MILAIDCGNTYSNIALFNSENEYQKFDIATKEIIALDSFDAVLAKINLEKVQAVIISSVVPSKNQLLREIFKQQKIIFVEEVLDKLELEFLLDNIKEVGADRVADSFYIAEKVQGAAIVIDFGTATTFDFVEDRRYLGGVIMPGIRLSIESLASQTEKLNIIEFKTPKDLIGHNTNDAICAGILYSNLGAIDYICKNSLKVFKQKPYIIATGGFGRVVIKNETSIDAYDPDLTLKGLYLIFLQVQKYDL